MAAGEGVACSAWGSRGSDAPSPRVPIVLGIDPGGRWTGLAARQGDVPLWASLVTRMEQGPIPGAKYLGEVVDEVELALEALGQLEHAGDVILAVEAMVEPRGYQMMRGSALIGPAMVLGAILGYFDSPILVPPARHGKGPQQAYPASFWGTQETAGTGRFRHIRSAWDIASAGLVLARCS